MAGYYPHPHRHTSLTRRANRTALRKIFVPIRHLAHRSVVTMAQPTLCPTCGCYAHELVIGDILTRQCNSNSSHRTSAALPLASE